MEPKEGLQEEILQELRAIRAELKELATHLQRPGAPRPWWGRRLLHKLDSSAFAPPHTFQSVLGLITAQLSVQHDDGSPSDLQRAEEGEE